MANPAPSQTDSDPYADRRVYPRVSTALPAFLLVEKKRHAVQIVDLSAGGAKLDCPTPQQIGAAVTLDCGTFTRSAVTRWQGEGFLGIRFDSELDHREMTALIGRSKALEAWKTRE